MATHTGSSDLLVDDPGRPAPEVGRGTALAQQITRITEMADPTAQVPVFQARARAGDGAAEGRLLLGIVQHRAKQLVAALLAFDDVVDVAERTDDTLLLMHVSRWQGVNLAMMGDRHRSIAALTRAAIAAERLGDLGTQISAIANLGYLHGEQDQPVPYRMYTERALVLARRLGDPGPVSSCLCNLAGALTRLHRFDEARAACDEGEPLAEAAGWEIGRARFLAGRACILAEEGRIDEAERLFDLCTTMLLEKSDFYQIARLAILRGGFHLESGRPEGALRHYATAVQLAETWSFESVLDDTLERQATAMEQVGDPRGAIDALRALLALRARREAERALERTEIDEARAVAIKARREAEDARRQGRALETATILLRAALEREAVLKARVDALTGS
jgi:tetratricopeptide (TPR) repeat protein